MLFFSYVAGIIVTMAVFLAAPLGGAVFGWLAVTVLCSAAGATSRREHAAGKLLLALTVAMVAGMVGACLLSPLHRTLLGILAVVLIALLFLRRRRVRKPKLPALSGFVRAALAVAGLTAGIVIGIVKFLDEEPRRFPHLEPGPAVVAPEGNAHPILQSMMERHDIWKDKDLRDLVSARVGSSEPPAMEWEARAREVVQRWHGCLAQLEDMLASRHFVSPFHATFDQLQNAWQQDPSPSYCSRLAHLVAVQSDLALAGGEPDEAMKAAKNLVRLGLLISQDPNSTMGYLVGTGILAIGERQMRKVAESPGMSRDSLLAEIEQHELTAELRLALTNALRAEYQHTRLMLEAMDGLEILEADDPTEERFFALGRALFRRAPGLKRGRTLNTLGAYLEAIAGDLDSWRPPPTVEDVFGPGKPTGKWGALRYSTTNPIGDTLVMMQMFTLEKTAAHHFRSLADSRLTQLLFALRCYQMENGALPHTLEELAPDYFKQVPVDPFSGKAFGYEPTAGIPRLYSVGPNQQLDEPGAEEDDDLRVEPIAPGGGGGGNANG